MNKDQPTRKPVNRPRPHPPRWREAAGGLVLGVLLAIGAELLLREVFSFLDSDLLIPLAGLAGALLAMTRGRSVLWVGGGLVVAGLAMIGYTPLVATLMPPLLRADPPAPAPAVVVLASTLQQDGELSSPAQDRLIHGYELLGQGYARRLVLTRLRPPKPSYVPTVRRQMQALRLDYPIDEVGPVGNTHDEAVAVARLARERGWSRVLLVTHPWHMRRAAGVFEKAGLAVIGSPCVEGRYDLSHLDSFYSRLAAFRDWAHEAFGLRAYRRRGWL